MFQTALTRAIPRSRELQDDPFFGSLLRSFYGDETPARGWVPPVDIVETEEAFDVTAELPGLTKKEVEVTVENNVMTIAGERRFEKDTKAAQHRSERIYGSFSRSFTLPREVDTENVKATFKNGLLTLSVPKQEKARPRAIEIT